MSLGVMIFITKNTTNIFMDFATFQEYKIFKTI